MFEAQLANYQDLAARLESFSEEDIKSFENFTPEQIDAYLWLKNMSAEELEKVVREQHPPGEAAHQPGYWEDSAYNHPSQPVVGISWFEAKAYCAWLSAQTGEQYGLPSEVE